MRVRVRVRVRARVRVGVRARVRVRVRVRVRGPDQIGGKMGMELKTSYFSFQHGHPCLHEP